MKFPWLVIVLAATTPIVLYVAIVLWKLWRERHDPY